MPRKAAGRTKVQPNPEPLPAERFYAGVKKKTGPKRKLLSEKLRAPPKRVDNPYRSYSISYKLRVLSYWNIPSIPSGPTKMRKPMRTEVINRFKISGTNLTRWRKEEAEGKFSSLRKGQQRISGGGRKRQWEEMERKLYDRFRIRRAMGGFVRRGWFRRVSKELFIETYPTEPLTNFCFSNGWFRGFLSHHRISLRLVTNKSSQLPSDFGEAILNWMRYNRRNSQIRTDDERGLGDEPATIGRYRLSNIINMDQTPLPFEYLEGQTYNTIGDRTIWVQGSQSGWDKRQGTVQLTVFADAIPRVKPLVFFRGQGIGGGVVKEMESYDPRVVVKFNMKAYANSENFLEWIDEQLIPVLDNQPTLLALDLFAAHKTQEVLDTFLANDIAVSLIPGGCTSLVQPLDVSINRPFKDILKEILEEKLDKIEAEEEEILSSGGKLAGSMVGRRRVLTTWAVGEAWEVFSRERVEVVKKAFRIVGLALPIDGSCDHEISIKGIDGAYLVEGLKHWEIGGNIVVDSEEDAAELTETDEDEDVCYEENV